MNVRDVVTPQGKTLNFEKQTEGFCAECTCSILSFEPCSPFFYRKDKYSKGVFLLKKKMNENGLNTIPANIAENGADMVQVATRAFADERRAAIMEMLEHNASVQVAEIAQTFGVSSVTARADLDALAEAGKLRRTHGGAVSLHKRLTVSTQDRRINVNVAAKQAIAQSAIELVSGGDTLLVDSGTTALEFVRLLDQRDGITVITADITIADYIDESMPSVDVVMLGGALRKGHRYLYGPLTMQALQMVHADLAIMCPGAFVPGCGFTTDFPQMAETKTAMIAAARQSVALMDASKVNGRGMYRFAELTDVDTIVMDRDPDHAVATSIAETTDIDAPTLIIATA